MHLLWTINTYHLHADAPLCHIFFYNSKHCARNTLSIRYIILYHIIQWWQGRRAKIHVADKKKDSNKAEVVMYYQYS